MSIETFPTTLKPDGFEIHIINGKELAIPVIHLAFKKWQGKPIANTFGGKGLVEYEGEPMFAELAIQKLAAKGGWNSRWVETYGMGKLPYYFTNWGDTSLKEQLQDPIVDQEQIDNLALVAKHNNDSYSGCWDVLMWNEHRTVFVEAKLTNSDRFRATQDRWLTAGLKAGLQSADFVIVWWSFIS
jgi:hypothetical protein